MEHIHVRYEGTKFITRGYRCYLLDLLNISSPIEAKYLIAVSRTAENVHYETKIVSTPPKLYLWSAGLPYADRVFLPHMTQRERRSRAQEEPRSAFC
jgi:hypothetical protein